MAHSHRILRWLRWLVLGLALTFAGFSIWFVLRIEKFIVARLPREVVVGNLSVSFIGSRFVLNEVQILARAGGACEGKVLATARQIEGAFILRQRKLESLTLSDVRLTADGMDRRCHARETSQREFNLHQYASPSGIVIDIREAVLPVREFGQLRLNTVANLTYAEPNSVQINADRVKLTGKNLAIAGQKIMLQFGKNGAGYELQSAAAVVTAKYSDLSKMPRLSSRKFSVRSGDAELKLTAQFAHLQWSVVTAVELRGVKVGGEPLYNMPMGLLQLTPENMWPMAEDAPGIFSFGFSTEATSAKLPAVYASDFKIALKNKVRKNLKKKIPVLPF